MSDAPLPGGGPARHTEPLTKFLLGCALVVGGLGALVIGGCGFFAWRLVRDETPNRPVEAILVGDENRYWCLDLSPEDPGIVALFERLQHVNDETRQRALDKTPLRGFPFPTRRADTHEILPMKLEVALRTDGKGEFPHDVSGWSGRATMSRGGLKLRAGLKLMRWMLTREQAEVVDVDGVQVTLVHDAGKQFAVATVGNRVLVADGVDRLRRSLAPPPVEGGSARLAGIPELHDAIRLEGEDGWAFAADTSVEGPDRPLPLLGAVASLDLTVDDALRFRVEVPAGDGAGLSTLSTDEAVAIVRSFVPRSSAEEITLDAGSPALDGHAWRIEGRISDLTRRLGKKLSEWPSAIPTPPSPPPTPDRRSDTPSAPPRGGNPNPAG